MATQWVWMTTASRDGSPVDMAGLMGRMTGGGFDAASLVSATANLAVFQDAFGLTVKLRGTTTADGFQISGFSVLRGNGQVLFTATYPDGSQPAPITDTSATGLASAMTGLVTAIETNSDLRIFGRGAIGADSLRGGLGDDILSGGNGDDAVVGGQGNDQLHGDWGRDTLAGWAGDDTLAGGGGRDVLSGGAGADSFKFYTAAEAAADMITDFSHAQGDVIDLSDIGAFVLSGNAAFHGIAGEVRLLVRSAGTYVQGDLDGDGLSDFSLLVRGVSDLQAADFIL